jgi:hypothetical protein
MSATGRPERELPPPVEGVREARAAASLGEVTQ